MVRVKAKLRVWRYGMRNTYLAELTRVNDMSYWKWFYMDQIFLNDEKVHLELPILETTCWQGFSTFGLSSADLSEYKKALSKVGELFDDSNLCENQN